MRGYNPYGVNLSALALFFAPLLNEGALAAVASLGLSTHIILDNKSF